MASAVLSGQAVSCRLPVSSRVEARNGASCPAVSFTKSSFCQGSASRSVLIASLRCANRSAALSGSRIAITANLTGENPDWSDDDYISLGLAHCFIKDDDAKLQDYFVIEAIPAGALECMDNGGVTCYKHVFGTNLGVALKMDVSLLPAEFQGATFAEDFDFRTKCASRTWKRQHPVESLMNLVPVGTVRSDFNYVIEDKRVLNMENVVSDSDNIKQDLSIDVYGRKEEADDKEIEKLYNV